MVSPRLCETARPLFKNPRPNYKSSKLRDCSTSSEPEIPRLLFRMPRFRDWADIFQDASFSHRAFYTPLFVFEKFTRACSICGACAICDLSKIYKCLLIPNCTRKIMWLLINNIYEKISRWLSRRNARVSRNQEKIALTIAPSRACAWFENRRFHWPSVSFSDHRRIRMLGLFPLFALN